MYIARWDGFERELRICIGVESGYEDMVRDIVDYLYKVFIDSILPKLRNIVDESKRYLYFLVWLNNELKKKGLGRIIITGIRCRDIHSESSNC